MDAPCRRLERSAVACPTCGKEVQLKTLTYSHRCRQSFHLEDRLVAIQRRQAEEASRREEEERIAEARKEEERQREEAKRLEDARRLVQMHSEKGRQSAQDLILASLRSPRR